MKRLRATALCAQEIWICMNSGQLISQRESDFCLDKMSWQINDIIIFLRLHYVAAVWPGALSIFNRLIANFIGFDCLAWRRVLVSHVDEHNSSGRLCGRRGLLLGYLVGAIKINFPYLRGAMECTAFGWKMFNGASVARAIGLQWIC